MIDVTKFNTLTFDCYGTLIDWERGIVAELRLAQFSALVLGVTALLIAIESVQRVLQPETVDYHGAIGFAAAMLARRKRGRAMALAVAAGAVAGLIRIGEGGHFLSDTVFAGVLMALTVALVHFLVFSVLGPRLPEEGWWHQRSLRHASDLGPRLGESKAKLGSAWSALRKPNA